MEDITYTCKIQLISFSDDEFEEKGIIDLEKALEVFELFPWNEQFQVPAGQPCHSPKFQPNQCIYKRCILPLYKSCN